ncbi:uncharacterized protein LOC126326125 [Schistocerca gregaria]|uniref:uncharacterized protein LOC126326125 n=1 Tax=Schistocerca gregaria TaxID=7010 RepID=UPI00211EDFF7|nr:uncharacterized protein LOC126326125 [Schistocerca gregaria]
MGKESAALSTTTRAAAAPAAQVEEVYGKQIESCLRDVFHHAEFRPPQKEIVLCFLGGHDCFVLMPTGGGKSLGFQIPALLFSGVTLVVSPLIALMQNQVKALRERGVAAEMMNHTLSSAERERVLKDMRRPQPNTKLLYITPELVQTKNFFDTLRGMYARGVLSAVVVDEAHAVSAWGHDFRPAYEKLGVLKEKFPMLPVMACTATATERVQLDVVCTLKLEKNCQKFLASFNRPNIWYEVRYKSALQDVFEDLRAAIASQVERGEPCGIVYCHKRAECDQLARRLQESGLRVAAYHAGMRDKERESTLCEWISGRHHIVVATIAFGMGIDNARVRFVLHYSMPKSLEDFYQESGRAGRDGGPSKSILYYSREDRDLRQYLIKKEAKQRAGSHRQLAFSKLVEYCERPVCRRRMLLSYFGESVSSDLCGLNCDCCSNPEAVRRSMRFLEPVQRLERFLQTSSRGAARRERPKELEEEGRRGKRVYVSSEDLEEAGVDLDAYLVKLEREEEEESARFERSSSSSSFRPLSLVPPSQKSFLPARSLLEHARSMRVAKGQKRLEFARPQ